MILYNAEKKGIIPNNKFKLNLNLNQFEELKETKNVWIAAHRAKIRTWELSHTERQHWSQQSQVSFYILWEHILHFLNSVTSKTQFHILESSKYA